MIQEIYPHQFENQYIETDKVGENDYILHYKDDSLLLKTNGSVLALPQRKDFNDFPKQTDCIFLFSLDNVPCHLVVGNLSYDNLELNYQEISFFRKTTQREIAWACLVGVHLKNWYQDNKFCGKCGSLNVQKHRERALFCPNCQSTIYPRISPAIIVAIVCKDKLLLARNVNFPAKWFSLVAGYADIGESLEDALIREVKEEVGLDVWNIRYYKSQPWPLSGSMMVGFIAEADENQPITVDGKEIAEAAWFTKKSLPEYPPNLSIAGEMIDKFKCGTL